jgi:hypothetical protein
MAMLERFEAGRDDIEEQLNVITLLHRIEKLEKLNQPKLNQL